jgi:hypothetical protein
MNTPRKIIQISVIPETAESFETLFALADDGTIWIYCPERNGTAWDQINLDALPEREE